MKNSKQPKLHFQRFEFKYQLPLDTVDGMVPELLKYMEFDPYARNLPGSAYTVASLYYDTAGHGAYYQKINGLKTRKKLRVRFYNFDLTPETLVFMEIKRKYDAVVVKDRVALPLRACEDLLRHGKWPDQVDPAAQATLEEFMWLKEHNSMAPQNIILYKRRPLFSKVDPNFRVTVDFDIKSYQAEWLTTAGHPSSVNPGMAILEVKFNNILPFWFHSIIRKYGLEQRPFSKYCNGLEVSHPQLAFRTLSEAFQPELTSNLKQLNLLTS